MKRFRCAECNKMFKDLTQFQDERGRVVVQGFCKDCYCYTQRPIEDEYDIDDLEEIEKDSEE